MTTATDAQRTAIGAQVVGSDLVAFAFLTCPWVRRVEIFVAKPSFCAAHTNLSAETLNYPSIFERRNRGVHTVTLRRRDIE